MTEHDCQLVANRDASTLASDTQKFLEANLLGYYVLLNTWLMLLQQWTVYGEIALRDYLLNNGLLKTIKELDTAASDVIHGRPVSFGLARSLLHDIQYANPPRSIGYDVELSGIDRDREAVFLLICRFPKRFSPDRANKLREASISAFETRQDTLKVRQQTPYSARVMQAVRRELCSIIDFDKLCDALEEFTIDDLSFTGGVSLECKADLYSKLVSVTRRQPEYFVSPFGIPLTGLSADADTANLNPLELIVPQYWGKYSKDTVRLVRIAAVPKNYKTARVIAPEMTVRQAVARRYFDIMDRFTPSGIPLHDQTINQELARYGSINGCLATLDLEAASDSITWSLLYDVLPWRFARIIREALPTHYIGADKQRHILQSAATMGNSITFWLESVLFYAIARAGVREYNLWAEEGKHVALNVSAYGDDLVVPTLAAETVIDYLVACGFTVNTDKSYYDLDNRYRESCGEEYRNGIRLTTIYFPRFPLMGTLKSKASIDPRSGRRDSYTGVFVDTMSALVDLQHKMYLTCKPAALLLQELILEAEPRMTRSTPDEGLEDLWAYEDVGTKSRCRLRKRHVVRRAKPRILSVSQKGIPKLGWDIEEVEDVTALDPSTVPVVPGESIQACDREGHLMPVSRFTLDKPLSEHEWVHASRLLWLYNYQQFLRHGPRYADDLMEILGISEPPMTLDQFMGVERLVWTIAFKP
jgi:hypothetical protein